jgi:hypothetical protein
VGDGQGAVGDGQETLPGHMMPCQAGNCAWAAIFATQLESDWVAVSLVDRAGLGPLDYVQ